MSDGSAPCRYILGDPSFVSFSGHCYEYIRSLAEPLRAAGHEVIIAGNRGLDGAVAAATGANGVFTYWCDARPTPFGIAAESRLGRALVRRAHERSVLRDLTEFDARIGVRASDVLVLNTFRHWGIRGIVRWLEALPAERVPRVALILHFSAYPVPGGTQNDSAMYRDAFAAIAASPRRGRFTLLADSDGLIAEYRGFTDLPIGLAPIPHTKVVAMDEAAAGGDPARPIVLTYAGEARTNKGFQFLPYVAERLQAAGTRRPYLFEIQTFIHDRSQPFYQLAMAKLERLGNCRLFDKQFDDAEYEAFVRRSDVMLIPYLTDNYHVQTSGIYAEAVSLGKPTVVSMGTWMADQVRRHGGGIAVPPGDHHALYEAVATIIDRYDEYKQAAAAASQAWRQFHTAERLIGLIDAGGAP